VSERLVAGPIRKRSGRHEHAPSKPRLESQLLFAWFDLLMNLAMTDCASSGTIFVLAAESALMAELRALLGFADYRVEGFRSLEQFVQRPSEDMPACLLIEFGLPGLDHSCCQRRLSQNGLAIPFIFVLPQPDTPATVKAMRAGAFSVVAAPFDRKQVLTEIESALDRAEESLYRCNELDALWHRLGSLTPREAGILPLVAAGKPNKRIAAELGIEESTVKVHRGRVMRKMRAESVAQLALVAEKLHLLTISQNTSKPRITIT
jgi:FixJ family two-component response regulator